MMSACFGRCYAYWQTRRARLFAAAVLLTLIMGGLAYRAPLREDIGAMLPDTPPAIHDTFESLRHAPFLQMILIDLKIEDEKDRDALHASVDALSGAMQAPFFTKVVTGVDDQDARLLMQWLLAHFPQLFTEEDAAEVAGTFEEGRVRERLEANLKLLAQPESVVMKNLVMADPLGLRDLLLRKLRYLSVVPQARLERSHFVSRDGLHALVIAQTSKDFTDVEGSAALVNRLQDLLKTQVAKGVQARVVCGHRYTAANAQVIKNDLSRVFAASTIGLLLTFVFFMRHRSAVLVFVLPFFALVFGLGLTSLAYSAVSGITIGFGAVLLGVCVDFGVYVYFELRDGAKTPREAIAALTPAISLCALTSVLTFSLLFLSSLPGQRQLAVFSVAGIVSAFLFAMLVLPHTIPTGGEPLRPWPVLRWAPRGLVPVWCLLVVLAMPFAWRVGFDGNLRSVGFMPPDAIADEIAIRETWGEVRDRAMAISEGATANEAFLYNDRLLASVKARFPETNVVSVAAFLPGQQTQEANLARWKSFWDEQGHAALAQKRLEDLGNELGYDPSAFAPFQEWIHAPRAPFDGASLRESGMAQWLGPLMGESGGKTQVVTFLEDTPRMAAFFQEPRPELEGVRYVSDRHFATLINAAMSRDFSFFMLCAGVSVILLLALLLRDWRRVLLSLLPAVSGVTFMLAALTLTGQKLNLFNMLGCVLLIGLTTDYGIVMLYRIEGRLTGSGERVVFVSGLTTLFGFGALTVARHPAMFSIGFTMVLGLAPGILSSLIFMPACARALRLNVKQEPSS